MQRGARSDHFDKVVVFLRWTGGCGGLARGGGGGGDFIDGEGNAPKQSPCNHCSSPSWNSLDGKPIETKQWSLHQQCRSYETTRVAGGRGRVRNVKKSVVSSHEGCDRFSAIVFSVAVKGVRMPPV